MKNYLDECSSKVTRQNGKRSEILVSNPANHIFDLSDQKGDLVGHLSCFRLKMLAT